jgi:PAS domain-containing protein
MRDITREILDALPAQVVLLDPTGRIEIVNEAWRKFAKENNLRVADFALGANYLEVCAASFGEEAKGAQSISEGIRAVLRAESSSFLQVYACHSPAKERWFQAIVTPVIVGEERFALVTHVDISPRVLAEQSLRKQVRQYEVLAADFGKERERLITAQAVAKVGSWDTDLLTLEVSWSEETHRIFGTDPSSFKPTHQSFLGLVHPDDRSMVDEAFQASRSTKDTRSLDHRIQLADDQIKYVNETWRIVAGDAGSARAVGTCQDISERQLINERLRESEARLERAQEITGIGSWEVDVQQGSLMLSKQMYIIHGLPLDYSEQLDIEALI